MPLTAMGDTAGAMAAWKDIIATSKDPNLLATAKMRVAYGLAKTKTPATAQVDCSYWQMCQTPVQTYLYGLAW